MTRAPRRPHPLLRPTLALVIGGTLLGACTTAGIGAGASPPAASAAPSSAATDPEGSAMPTPLASVTVPADVLGPVLADAATQAGVEVGAVVIVEASAQTWPNGALGCPSPGVMYTQAIVNGWRVVVTAGGKRIDYRTSAPGRFKVCKSLGGG